MSATYRCPLRLAATLKRTYRCWLRLALALNRERQDLNCSSPVPVQAASALPPLQDAALLAPVLGPPPEFAAAPGAPALPPPRDAAVPPLQDAALLLVPLLRLLIEFVAARGAPARILRIGPFVPHRPEMPHSSQQYRPSVPVPSKLQPCRSSMLSGLDSSLRPVFHRRPGTSTRCASVPANGHSPTEGTLPSTRNRGRTEVL